MSTGFSFLSQKATKGKWAANRDGEKMLKRFKSTSEDDVFIAESPDGECFNVPFKNNWTVLSSILDTELNIATSCGGMGTCGTCRVEIIDAPESLEERNEIEIEMAEARGFNDKERLACQITACRGLKVRIP
jgi:2Fe-2S ferredoxin